MSAITVRGFAGRIPKFNDRQLPERHATRAENTDFRTFGITPLKGYALETQAPMTRVRGMHRTRYGRWIYFDDPTDVVDSVIGDDPYERIFFARHGQEPRVANRARAGVGSIRLGVPAPLDPPTISVRGDLGPEEEPESRTYAVTLVNEFGEEGPPSEPSEVVEVGPNQTVAVEVASLLSGLNSYAITSARIYRSSGGAFLYVAETPISLTSYSDDRPNVLLGEAVPSMNWYGPPDSLDGLVSVPGGFLAAWYGNQLLFSEQGLPHAWPFEFRQSVDWNIVGCGVSGNSVVVCTEGSPYIAQGSVPEAMQLQKVASEQSCTSRESIVSMLGGVVYASPEGLVSVSSTGVEVITERVFTKAQWRALNPETMRGLLWERLYICLHDNGAFLINPASPDAGVVDLPFATRSIDASFNDLSIGNLYIAIGNEIHKWGAGAEQRYTWKSRRFELVAPAVMKFAQVMADAYPVDITLVNDAGNEVTAQATSEAVVKLPSPAMSRSYSVQVSSTAEITSLVVSPTMQEMRSV